MPHRNPGRRCWARKKPKARRSCVAPPTLSPGSSLSDRQWRQLLHDGFSEEIVVDGGELSVGGEAKVLSTAGPSAATEVDTDQVEVIFVPADGIYDGRFANNGWLQEMPQSLTKLAWDNAAVMSPADRQSVEAASWSICRPDRWSEYPPARALPGCPSTRCPDVPLAWSPSRIGYGRTRAGMVGGNEEEGVEIVGIDVSSDSREETRC